MAGMAIRKWCVKLAVGPPGESPMGAIVNAGPGRHNWRPPAAFPRPSLKCALPPSGDSSAPPAVRRLSRYSRWPDGSSRSRRRRASSSCTALPTHERDAVDPDRPRERGRRELARRRRARLSDRATCRDRRQRPCRRRAAHRAEARTGTATYRVTAGADRREGTLRDAALVDQAEGRRRAHDRDRLLLLSRRRESRVSGPGLRR